MQLTICALPVALLIDFTSRTDPALRLAIKAHSQSCCQAKCIIFTGFLEPPFALRMDLEIAQPIYIVYILYGRHSTYCTRVTHAS